MSNRRRNDEALRMPPPSTSTSAAGPVLYYPEDDDRPLTQCLAPPSSPPPRQPTAASTSRRPVFGRFSSTGPRRRSALDTIGYPPENIPTPRTTRPFSITTGGTRKRKRGLKLLTTATSPVRPAPRPSIQPTASPSKHVTAAAGHSSEGDDDEYTVDSSGDERPLPFNLPPEDGPRPSKVARTSTNNTPARPDPTRISTAATPSTSRIAPGATPAHRRDLATQLGITPARPAATPRSKNPDSLISATPIRLDLSSKTPVYRPSPFVSSAFPPPVVSKRASEGSAGPSRLSELSRSNSVSSSGAKRAFSSASANPPPPPIPTGTGTKRGPSSKSTSPGASGAKRPRIATPSPPSVEDIIVVSSSDEEEGEPSAEKPVEMRPSPSPSLGEYRPTPTHSRSGSRSSDVVLLESPSNGTRRGSSKRGSLGATSASTRDPPREATPERALAPEEAPRRASTPKDAPRPNPPSTPSPSRHSSSSEQQPKAKRRLVKKVVSDESLQPVVGRRVVPGTGRRKRLSRREAVDPEPSPSPSSPEAEPPALSPREAETSASRPVDSLPEGAPSQPTKSSPFKRADSSPRHPDFPPPRRADSPPRTTRSPSPVWTGKPLFRPSTTVSDLTSLRDRFSPVSSAHPSAGPSKSHGAQSTKSHDTESSKPHDVEPTKSPERAEHLGDEDPLETMYDHPSRPLFGRPLLPQYRVLGPPSESPGPSVRVSSPARFSRYSFISSMPPPTITSSVVPARHRRMECVLLPRASKATRLALERSERKKPPSLTITIPRKKDKGKAKDISEYPLPTTSSSEAQSSISETQSSSSSSPSPEQPPVKYLVIDPQLAVSSNYESLPADILESPDKYCHCCRTKSGVGKLKMRCGTLSYRRRRFSLGPDPQPCGTYWCQRCVAKHDIPFNPTLATFKCPLCTGTCECDICRRHRGHGPDSQPTYKVVKKKPGKRTLDAFVKERPSSGSRPAKLPGVSNPTAELPEASTSIAESSDSANPTAEPSGSANPIAGPSGTSSLTAGPDSTSGRPEPTASSTGPESESSSAAAPISRRASAPSGPTTWHGRHTPPPLRHRRASGGHALSSTTHVFIKRGSRVELVDTTLEPADESLEYAEPVEPVPEEHEDGPPVEEEPVWEDRHQVFEGDYSAAGDASLLGADSGAFEFGVEHEHEPDDLGGGDLGRGAEDTGIMGGTEHLGVEEGAVDVVSGDGGAGDSGIIDDAAHSVAEGEGEPPAAPTEADNTSPDPTLAIGTLAYPPSEPSEGSHPDAPVDMHTVLVEPVPPTLTGTLDPIPTGVLDGVVTAGVPAEIPHDTLTRIFHESIQGFAEGETSPIEHGHDSTALSRRSSEVDELQSSEPHPSTPDLDAIRAELDGDSLEQELNSDLGELHPEGTFETVPGISMGDVGGWTIHGSLRDISLFHAVMDCSDETHDIALSPPQTEPALTVCGSLLGQLTPVPFPYPCELEPLAISELEDFESEPEHEPDLVPTSGPESIKSTILETPSPRLESDTDSNPAEHQSLFDISSPREPRAPPFILPAEEKQVRVRRILRSRFSQPVEPKARATRSQTRKSTMERSKLLRSKRCYGADS
ncbi:unnamed protein product [Rhizoctonia solani]|uniref:Zinc-finger domain-containing protein n=1 Tax=Rhizoctonia solani TaxID=456999 RepID=A0A8H3D4B2_9AGAM|nr:unnamed protein product [Rhizoctonia solani]